MAIRTYEVTLTGKMPLLMHHDNILWADQMDAWKNNADNAKGSKAGDDRSPPWRWIGCVYHDGARLVIPTDNIAKCLMEGGVMVPVPGGKGGKTFKAQTMSGMTPEGASWPLIVDGHEIPWKPIEDLIENRSADFTTHRNTAEDLGFELFVKRAAVGASKHIRVRPRFDDWQATGRIIVWDEQITEAVLREMLRMAGTYKGLGDWRPGAPKKPGPHGTFDATVREVQ